MGFCGDGFNAANTPSFCADGVFVRVQDLGWIAGAPSARGKWRSDGDRRGTADTREGGNSSDGMDVYPPKFGRRAFRRQHQFIGRSGNSGVIPSVNMLQKELVWFGLWNLEAIEADEAAIEGLVSNASLTVGEEISLELTDLNAGITQFNGQWRIAESGFTAEFYFSNSAPGFALYPLHELLSPAASED